jgi:predicted nuclease with TOPRIM domain
MGVDKNGEDAYAVLHKKRLEERIMTTLTDKITHELLDCVGNPAGLEKVLGHYGKSKGPLYGALAQATASLREQLVNLSEKAAEAQAEYEEEKERREAVSNELAALQEEQTLKADELQAVEAKLEEAKGIVGQAGVLASMGFGHEELGRLYELLVEIAASQGGPPEDGVAQFFKTVSRYEKVISLDLEAKSAEVKAAQAKAEASKWEAEAKQKETHSKARIATINLVEKLLEKGVKEQDLPHWAKVLEKVQVSPEKLAAALEEHGTLVALCQERAQHAEKLQMDIEEAEAGLKALNQEEAKVKAAITAVRDGALQHIKKTGEEAKQQVGALSAKAWEYGDLQHQVAQLEGELALARALKSDSEYVWSNVPRESIQALIMGMIKWSRIDSRDRKISPPSFVCAKTSLGSWHQVALSDLLVWAFTGVITEEEWKALGGS